MAVFLPVLPAAIEEARRLMPSANLFSPADGSPAFSLGLDLALGFHWLCREDRGRLERLLGSTVEHAHRPQEIFERLPPDKITELLPAFTRAVFRAATESPCSISLADLGNCELAEGGNPIKLLATSGARDSTRQLEIILDRYGRTVAGVEVTGNLSRGLSIGEYYWAASDARTEQVGRQLETPKAGYLMRWLVYRGQHLQVSERETCDEPGFLDFPLEIAMRHTSRFSVQDLEGRIIHVDGREVTVTRENWAEIAQLPVLRLRSPLTCGLAPASCCRRCYGWDLSQRAPVEPGSHIGILAAQSLCERIVQRQLSRVHKSDAGPRVQGRAHRAEAALGVQDFRWFFRNPFAAAGRVTPEEFSIWTLLRFLHQGCRIALVHLEVLLVNLEVRRIPFIPLLRDRLFLREIERQVAAERDLAIADVGGRQLKTMERLRRELAKSLAVSLTGLPASEIRRAFGGPPVKKAVAEIEALCGVGQKLRETRVRLLDSLRRPSGRSASRVAPKPDWLVRAAFKESPKELGRMLAEAAVLRSHEEVVSPLSRIAWSVEPVPERAPRLGPSTEDAR